jgi:predicted CXXCH cytochrome family protein
MRARVSYAAVLAAGCGAATALGAPADRYAGNCTDAACHGDFAKRAVVHSPAEAGTCDACHEADKDQVHKFKLVHEGAKLCTECHEEERFQGKVVHSPVSSGQCTACHDPHGSKAKGLLRQDVGETCAECHSETTEGLAFVHGPAAIGQCTACHTPHAGEHAKLLHKTGKSLCLECHSDIEEKLTASKHVHQPVDADCLSCHKPHGAANKSLLASSPPGLCLDCHDTIAESVDAKFKHSPVTSGEGCATCHNPHASAAEHLLTRATAKETCLSCHDKEIDAGGRKIMGLATHLASNAHAHGPVADGNCAACHNPHGSSHATLVGKAYPADFYSAFSNDAYQLCFECHEASAFESAETEDATEFRNGTQNLHFVHVNKAKGRTCRACHDPHASKNDKHIVESVKFGKWNIPINFKQTPTGGSCGPGCHRPYGYDREQPAANAVAGGQ